MRRKADSAENRQTETLLLRQMSHAILPYEKIYGGGNMLIPILSLTYMMIIILIHAIWIGSIIKHGGKCLYKDCGHCPYDGTCPMQKGAAHDTD